eukprot:RCo044659
MSRTHGGAGAAAAKGGLPARSIDFRYLVTFDNSNVKIRFVGCASSLEEFYALLSETVSFPVESYIVHIFDEEFEDYVRLDNFGQLVEGKAKLLLVASPGAPPASGTPRQSPPSSAPAQKQPAPSLSLGPAPQTSSPPSAAATAASPSSPAPPTA